MTRLPLGDRFSRTAKKVTTFTHWWTIENFSFHPKDKGIVSPLFSAGLNDGVEWKLFLYPDGTAEEGRGLITLHLKMVSCRASEAFVTFKIRILNVDHVSITAVQSNEPGVYTSKTRRWGCIIDRSQILSHNNFPGDTLILRSEISYAAEGVPPRPSLNSPFPSEVPECKSSADFRELLESGQFSDVVFNVRGKEFRAHKAILATRSPTFKSLFERNSGNIVQPMKFEIRDADDDTVSDLLHLIYSGNESFQRIQNLLSEVAAQGQTTPTIDSPDVKKEVETSSADDSTASMVSVLESIDKIARADHLAIGLTPSVALSSEFPTEEPIRAEEVTEKPLSENIELVLPSERNEDIQDDQMRAPSIGTAEQIQVLTPVVGVRAFHGDKSQFFEWWREFKVQVHDRVDLSPPEKFVQLLIALKGETRECIDTTECVKRQYFGTLDSLFYHYGRIEALPPGMFELMIVRRPDFSALPLCIVDNRMLMERIEEIHRVSAALESVESSEIKREGKLRDSGSDMIPTKDPKTNRVLPHIEFPAINPSGCRCQALNSSEDRGDHVMQLRKSNCVVAIEQQLGKLESIFAETQSPDLSTQETLAEEIGLTPAAIERWFKLRAFDWRKALQPNRQHEEIDASNGSSTQTETIDSDSSDIFVIGTHSWPSSAMSSASSSSESDFQLV